MTAFEQRIYNTFLRVSRTCKGLPFKLRQNFEGFESNEDFVYVQKLAAFFTSYKHVNIELFFTAPYEVYSKTENFYLDFYTTHKATVAYTIYCDRLTAMDPDSQPQLQFIVKSLKFIKEFCIEHSLPVEQYLTHTDGATPSFIVHLLQRDVSVYCLFAFTAFEKSVFSFDRELVDFILGSKFLEQLPSQRVKYLTSKTALQLAKQGVEKICKK